MQNIRIKLIGIITSILLLSIGTYVGVADAHRGGIDATGTGADTSFIIKSVKLVGVNTVLQVQGSGVVTGDFTGTYTFSGAITIDPQGNENYEVIDVCECTILGKSGRVVVEERGSGTAGGEFSADLRIVKAYGDLAGLSGRGTLQGQQDPATLLTSWVYRIHVDFRS
jgi:hypothetical protein